MTHHWRLTPRERDVLRLLLDGQGRQQIAGSLAISEDTVKTHLSNIYAELGVGSALEALALALRSRDLRRFASTEEVTTLSPEGTTPRR